MRGTALEKQCRNVRIYMVSRSCPPFAHPAGRRVYKKGPSRAVRHLAHWRKRPVFPQSCRQKPVAVAALAATAALRVMRGPQGKAGLPAWFPRPGLPVSSGAAWCEVHEPYGGGSAPALHGIPFSSRCSGYHCRAYFRRGQAGCQCRTRPRQGGCVCAPRLPRLRHGAGDTGQSASGRTGDRREPKQWAAKIPCQLAVQRNIRRRPEALSRLAARDLPRPTRSESR